MTINKPRTKVKENKGIYQINFTGDLDNFLVEIDQILLYLFDPIKNLPPNKNLPKIFAEVVKPQVSFYISAKRPNNEYLHKILAHLSARSEYLKNLVFVGKNWLAFDKDEVVKASGDFRLIVVNNSILKVYPNKSKFTDFYNSIEKSPKEWSYIVKLDTATPD